MTRELPNIQNKAGWSSHELFKAPENRELRLEDRVYEELERDLMRTYKPTQERHD